MNERMKSYSACMQLEAVQSAEQLKEKSKLLYEVIKSFLRLVDYQMLLGARAHMNEHKS